MKPIKRARKVIVVTSVMLSFISFWRAAAIVLNDLGSSAYNVGGIAEQAVGRAAPVAEFPENPLFARELAKLKAPPAAATPPK